MLRSQASPLIMLRRIHLEKQVARLYQDPNLKTCIVPEEHEAAKSCGT